MPGPVFFVYDSYRVGVTTAEGISHDVCALHPLTADAGPVHATRCLADAALRHQEILDQLGSGNPARIAPGRLHAPLPRPLNVFGAPVNYAEHRGELGAVRSPAAGTTRDLGLFVKATGSVSGPEDSIELPNLPGREFHHEGEIAIVIGRPAEDVSVDDALSYVAGFTGALDITMRLEENFREERSMRKSYKTFTPTGPAVLPLLSPELAKTLSLRLRVNGEQRQQGSLAQLIVSVPELVALASSIVSLQPGDLILSGTPSGVGPLTPGDKVSLEVDGLAPLVLVVEQKSGPLSAAGWIKDGH